MAALQNISWLCKNFFRNFCLTSRRLCTGAMNVDSTFRTHTCGELRAEHAGQEVTICGWIKVRRFDKFIVLKDGYGAVQILLDHCDPAVCKYMTSLPLSSVVQIKGIAQKRPGAKHNKEMATGEMEIWLKEAKLLCASSPDMPFSEKESDKVGNIPNLQHRYLYLRREHMQNNLRTRSQVEKKMRDYLSDEKGFVNVQTPSLVRPSPGGAKEFLVLSDFPGRFYALTQSPQQYKQLLMVSLFEKYYQFAICYRNEGTKYDRQPEFTQVDIEASFCTAEGIKCLVEGLLKYSWPKDMPEICIPFPCMTYKDAMHQYGTDKPDLRYEMKLQYLTEVLTGQGIKIFDEAVTCADCVIAAIVVPSGYKHISKSQLQELKAKAEFFSQNLLDIQIKKDFSWNSSLAKHVSVEVCHRVNDILNVKLHDLVLISAGKYIDVVQLLGRIRVQCCEFLESGSLASKSNDFRFLWVEDFPLFMQKEDGCLESAHHPFTAPYPNHVDLVYTSPSEAIGQHYDLVLNGQEIGGGSIRIHDVNLQRYILEDVLKVEVDPFKHLLDALECGCPPHGGIALGFDRLLAIICGCKSISDVIAFPKSGDGKDLMSGAPVLLSEAEACEIRKFIDGKEI